MSSHVTRCQRWSTPLRPGWQTRWQRDERLGDKCEGVNGLFTRRPQSHRRPDGWCEISSATLHPFALQLLQNQRRKPVTGRPESGVSKRSGWYLIIIVSVLYTTVTDYTRHVQLGHRLQHRDPRTSVECEGGSRGSTKH